jgi:hypothetical protein
MGVGSETEFWGKREGAHLQSLRKFFVARGQRSVNKSITMSPTLVFTNTAISVSLDSTE